MASSTDPPGGVRADRWLASGALGAQEARRIAEALARRHAAAARAPEEVYDPAARRRALARAMEALVPYAPALGGADALAEAEARQVRFLAERADRLLARGGDGRILARAVPLRLADVTLPPAGDPGEVRIASEGATGDEAGPGDVARELAGLMQELAVAGAPGSAERLLSHYAGEADDFDLYAVVDFHERAIGLERAVNAVEQAQRTTADARRTAALGRARRALERAREGGRRGPIGPFVLATGGGVASGKSTVARALVDRLGAPRVVADRVGDRLLEGAPRPPGAPLPADVPEPGWPEAFAPDFHARVYAELLRRGEGVLASGRPVVLDACFPRPFERAAVRALALRHGLPFRFIECRVDAATRQVRLAARDTGTGHGGDWAAIAARLDASWVAPASDPLPPEEHLVLDTARPVEHVLAELLGRLAAPSGLAGEAADGEA